MGAYLSSCRPGTPPTCAGCGMKPTWNGHPDEYCSKACRNAHAPKCVGCGEKPSWNGQHGEYCNKSCRSIHLGHSPVCVGCGKKPTWNGKPGEYCSKPCRSTHLGNPPVCVGCGKKPTWNGKPGEFCSKTCRSAPPDSTCEQLDQGGQKYKELSKQFCDTWAMKGDAKLSMPHIEQIWSLHDPRHFGRYDQYCRKLGYFTPWGKGDPLGNQQRRFHGTSVKCKFNGVPCGQADCKQCSIIKTGFQMKCCARKGSFFGRGIYVTSASSAACRFAKDGKNVNGAVFVAGVACGNAQVLEGKDLTDKTQLMDLPGCPNGFHSRVINNPHDSQAYIDHEKQYKTPLLKCDNEIVVFNDDAILPKYLIVFTTTNT